MYDVSSRAFLTWKVLATLIHAIALPLTIFRLVIRSRLSKLWWDDYVVIIPFTFDAFYMFTFWTAKREEVMNWWEAIFPATVILWSSRAVLSLGLMRIFPPRSMPRYIYAGLTVLTGIICSLSFKFPLCPQTPQSPVMFRLVGIGNLTCDSLMALAPICIFRKVKLLRVERRTIFFAFGTGMVPCVIPILLVSVQCYSTFRLEALGIMLCQVLAPLALLVCNLLVVMSSTLRALRRRRTNNPPEINIPDVRPAIRPVADERATSIRAGRSAHIRSATILSETNLTTHLTLTEILDSYVLSDSIAS